MNDYSCISALRVDLYDCDGPPAEIIRVYAPVRYCRRAWIPQSIADQIWVLYEFESEEERVRWECGLDGIMKKWLDRGLIKHALPYGWAVRDINGFTRD